MSALLLVALILSFALGAAPARATEGSTLARAIATRAGLGAFDALESVSFTWTHHPSGTARSYAWDLRAHTVAVSMGEQTIIVPSRGVVPEDLRDAHAAFINDSYWAFFELHLGWDEGVQFEALGEREVPGFPALGSCPALAVRYGSEGGYTPGDHYVLYVGEEGLPVAWAFHRGGAVEPSLVTLRTGWILVGGLSIPTRFEKDEGTLFISVSNLEVR